MATQKKNSSISTTTSTSSTSDNPAVWPGVESAEMALLETLRVGVDETLPLGLVLIELGDADEALLSSKGKPLTPTGLKGKFMAAIKRAMNKWTAEKAATPSIEEAVEEAVASGVTLTPEEMAEIEAAAEQAGVNIIIEGAAIALPDEMQTAEGVTPEVTEDETATDVVSVVTEDENPAQSAVLELTMSNKLTDGAAQAALDEARRLVVLAAEKATNDFAAFLAAKSKCIAASKAAKLAATAAKSAKKGADAKAEATRLSAIKAADEAAGAAKTALEKAESAVAAAKEVADKANAVAADHLGIQEGLLSKAVEVRDQAQLRLSGALRTVAGMEESKASQYAPSIQKAEDAFDAAAKAADALAEGINEERLTALKFYPSEEPAATAKPAEPVVFGVQLGEAISLGVDEAAKARIEQSSRKQRKDFKKPAPLSAAGQAWNRGCAIVRSFEGVTKPITDAFIMGKGQPAAILRSFIKNDLLDQAGLAVALDEAVQAEAKRVADLKAAKEAVKDVLAAVEPAARPRRTEADYEAREAAQEILTQANRWFQLWIAQCDYKRGTIGAVFGPEADGCESFHDILPSWNDPLLETRIEELKAKATAFLQAFKKSVAPRASAESVEETRAASRRADEEEPVAAAVKPAAVKPAAEVQAAAKADSDATKKAASQLLKADVEAALELWSSFGKASRGGAFVAKLRATQNPVKREKALAACKALLEDLAVFDGLKAEFGDAVKAVLPNGEWAAMEKMLAGWAPTKRVAKLAELRVMLEAWAADVVSVVTDETKPADEPAKEMTMGDQPNDVGASAPDAAVDNSTALTAEQAATTETAEKAVVVKKKGEPMWLTRWVNGRFGPKPLEMELRGIAALMLKEQAGLEKDDKSLVPAHGGETLKLLEELLGGAANAHGGLLQQAASKLREEMEAKGKSEAEVKRALKLAAKSFERLAREQIVEEIEKRMVAERATVFGLKMLFAMTAARQAPFVPNTVADPSWTVEETKNPEAAKAFEKLVKGGVKLALSWSRTQIAYMAAHEKALEKAEKAGKVHVPAPKAMAKGKVQAEAMGCWLGNATDGDKAAIVGALKAQKRKVGEDMHSLAGCSNGMSEWLPEALVSAVIEAELDMSNWEEYMVFQARLSLQKAEKSPRAWYTRAIHSAYSGIAAALYGVYRVISWPVRAIKAWWTGRKEEKATTVALKAGETAEENGMQPTEKTAEKAGVWAWIKSAPGKAWDGTKSFGLAFWAFTGGRLTGYHEIHAAQKAARVEQSKADKAAKDSAKDAAKDAAKVAKAEKAGVWGRVTSALSTAKSWVSTKATSTWKKADKTTVVATVVGMAGGAVLGAMAVTGTVAAVAAGIGAAILGGVLGFFVGKGISALASKVSNWWSARKATKATKPAGEAGEAPTATVVEGAAIAQG